MADSTLDSELFVLRDWWPEAPTLTIDDLPEGGVMDIRQQNVTVPAYEPLTKLLLWNNGTAAGVNGWSTLIYLQAEVTGHTAIVQQVFVHDVNTSMYIVTNDPDGDLLSDGMPMFGISLSAMADVSFGWFWCGGVAPESHCADMGGNYLTVYDLAVGPFTIVDLTADNIGFAIVDADTEAIAGYAFSACA